MNTPLTSFPLIVQPSPSLLDGYSQFTLSRQAMKCSAATIAFYRFTAGAFLTWLASQGVARPADLSVRHVREYLAKLAEDGKSATTVHDHARAIRTLVRFWNTEGYLPAPILFEMPLLEKKRLPVLTAEELTQIIGACNNARDRALVLFIADSGLRREEICALNCGDVDIASGLIHVRHGKGRKDRSAVIGPTARRSLLGYRRELASPIFSESALFLSRDGRRLTGAAVLLMFRRLSARAGIHVTAHALRRTFVILYLRAGGDVLHLQAQLGHSSLEMVKHYAQMVDDDLLQDHRAHSPIDNLTKLTREARTAAPFSKGATRITCHPR